jgi:pyruvate dehydrogenase E1 component alpha subunit
VPKKQVYLPLRQNPVPAMSLVARTERDPINHVRDLLLAANMADEDQLKNIDKDVKGIVAEAADFAQQSPEPDPAELHTDILREA